MGFFTLSHEDFLVKKREIKNDCREKAAFFDNIFIDKDDVCVDGRLLLLFIIIEQHEQKIRHLTLRCYYLPVVENSIIIMAIVFLLHYIK